MPPEYLVLFESPSHDNRRDFFAPSAPQGGLHDKAQTDGQNYTPIFEKISSHPDCAGSNAKKFLESMRPLPTVRTKSGELKEFCFGFACAGCRCPGQRCNRPHIHADCGIQNTPRAAMRAFRDWLYSAKVKARIRLTAEARAIPCLKP